MPFQAVHRQARSTDSHIVALQVSGAEAMCPEFADSELFLGEQGLAGTLGTACPCKTPSALKALSCAVAPPSAALDPTCLDLNGRH